MKKQNNYAFVDGQNLHLGVSKDNWKIDFKKFRIYLRDKYSVSEAYYFLGHILEKENSLYKNLQRAGFILIFRDHTSNLSGKKKGNVDVDIVFEVMKFLYEEPELISKIVLVSGDGDYKRLVTFLIKHEKFIKILFPNKKFASSLYDEFGSEHCDQIANLKDIISF